MEELVCTMGMELDEEPVGPAWDLDSRFEPEVDAVDVRGLTGLQTAVLSLGNQTQTAPTPTEDERARDQHQAIWRSRSDADVDAPIVRAGLLRVIDRVVDAVDLPRLGGAGGGGVGEIGITTRLAQHVELVVHPAPAAVGSRVIQRPVPVDEPEGRLAGPPIAGEQSMTGSQAIAGFEQRPPEVLGRVVVMVQVDLNLAVARAAKPGQRLDKLRFVLLDRIEEGVPGSSPVAVAAIPEALGIVAHPSLDARACYIVRGVPHAGLEVVGDADQDIDRPAGTTEPSTGLQPIVFGSKFAMGSGSWWLICGQAANTGNELPS